MRLCALGLALLTTSATAAAQGKPASTPAATSVTVPANIDHNRVVIDVDIPLSDGSTQRVHAWVDNGDPELWMSQRVAQWMGLSISCNGQTCQGHPPLQAVALEVLVGGMKIFLPTMQPAKIPLTGEIVDGMHVELNIPSTVLRQHDVLIDFPGRKFTIGAAGTIHFQGSSAKVQIAENGLIQVPSQIENKKYNLALDVGSSISFLSEEIFDKLAAAHPDWPHMTGAVGSANMWGAQEETKWKVMRLDRLQYGPLYLTNAAVVALPEATRDFFQKRAAMPTVGLLGSNALLNYRVGLDYAHSMVYFDIGRLFNFPDFDVIGLILRPEGDGSFSILGVADFDGKPSVPTATDGVQPGDHLVAVNDIPVVGSTMGQVWAMLAGTPGQERTLTIERAGKQFKVAATVQHFLGELPGEKERKKKKK